MRYLFSDKLHFHTRNFKSLIDFCECNSNEVFYNTENHHLMGLKGNYNGCEELFSEYIKIYSVKSKEDVFEASYSSINLYYLARSELFCYLSTLDDFIHFDNSFDELQEFDWIFERFNAALLLNIAAAHFWIDFWEKKLNDLPTIHNVIVFSGSTIYTKSLLEITKRKISKAYVAESFFTGDEYYLERKNTHISNNSDLKFKNILSSYVFATNYEYDRERIKAHNKLRTAKNRNVQQPSSQDSDILFEGQKYILIIGQVVNDFSILENKSGIRNTLIYYKVLIQGLLDKTEQNIVFKCHPWERHNVNLKKPKTLDYLNKWLSELPRNVSSRITVTEDYNLRKLMKNASYFITICSQAGLEAAYQGFKPIQLGNAFYGRKGFTYDIESCEQVEQVAEIVNSKSGQLDFNEFSAYEEFLTIALQKHLVSVHKSGFIRLRSIFEKKDYIKLVDISSAVEFQKQLKNNSQVTTSFDKTPVQSVKVSKVEERLKKNSSLVLSKKRYQKLKRNPYAYFRDSKHTFLRPIRLLFKGK